MRRIRLQFWGAALMVLAACNAHKSAPDAQKVEENAAFDMNAAAGGNEADLIFCEVIDARISQDDCDDLKKVESQVQSGVGAFNVPNPMVRDKVKAITLVVDRRSPEEIAAIEAPKPAKEVVELQPSNATIEANAVENEAVNAVENESSNEASGEDGQPPPPQPPPPPPSPPPPPAADHAAPTPSQIVEPLEGETETLVPKVGRFMSADLSGDGFKIDALSPASQEIPPGEQAMWQWNVTPVEGGTHIVTLKTVVEGVVAGKRYPLSRTQTIRSVTVKVGFGGWLADKIAQLTRGLNLLYTLLVALGLVVTAALGVWKPWKNRNKE